MTGSLRALSEVDEARLVVWVPLGLGLAGLGVLAGLQIVAAPYVALLLSLIGYALAALVGPARWRGPLISAAPTAYALHLLAVWGTALYVLPAHPASPMALLACVLHLTTLYVLAFLQRPPGEATRWAGAALGAFVVGALPHSVLTLGGRDAFDSVTLPITLLLAHGALITALRGFSLTRAELIRAQERAQAMHDLAYRDPLTALPNRRALERDLTHAADGGAGGWQLAVIDVDGLKRVNDTLGHAAGDDLLRRFGRGFAAGVARAGAGGQAYHLSGDEFALLARGVGEAALAAVVQEVTDEARVLYPGARASLGISGGRRGEDPSAWLSRADRAMYRHKARTGGGEAIGP